MTVAVDAALANWNGAAYLPRCIDALQAQTHSLQSIVVVDNGSTDGSDRWLAQDRRSVRLLQNPDNKGYCVGYNQAIAATSAPYVLALHTDVFLPYNVPTDFITRLRF